MSDAEDLGTSPSGSPNISSDQEWKPRRTSGFVFRVEKEFDEQRTRLTISGEISSECAELVESCCQQAISDGKAVDLVLDATNIDESGRALLRSLAAKGVYLVAKGVYYSYVVDTIRQAVSREPAL
jgi:hypothetical protein